MKKVLETILHLLFMAFLGALTGIVAIVVKTILEYYWR